MTKKQKKYISLVKKIYPAVVGSVIILLLVALLLSVNNYAFGKILFGSNFGYSVNHSGDTAETSVSSEIESDSTPTPTPTPSPTPLPTFSPVPLVPVPEDDLQARKDAFNEKVKAFVEKSKAEGVSNTAIANTIRFQYELEFGANADSEADYSNCLVEYNTKLSEYNSCMLSDNYGCYKPVNNCVKPLDAGF